MQLNRTKAWTRFASKIVRVRILNCIATVFVTSGVVAQEYEYNAGAGKTNYMLQCQGCHKAGGEGIEGSIPDMSKHGIEMLSSERGRQFFVAVPGSSQSPLSDRRLADVLNYISTDLIASNKTNANIQLFDTSEVTKYRGVKMKNVAQERAQIVDQIERQKQSN